MAVDGVGRACSETPQHWSAKDGETWAADRTGQGPEAPQSYSWKFRVSSQMVSDQVYIFQMWSRTWPCELAADRDSLEMRRPQN